MRTYRLPRPLKVRGHRVRAGRLAAGVREPRVPDRVQLRAVIVVELVVHPARTARLLIVVLPVRVAVAGVSQKRSTYLSIPTIRPHLASPMYCISRQYLEKPPC